MEKTIDQTPTEKIIQEVWNRLHASTVIPWDAPMGINETLAVKFLNSHKQPTAWWLDAQFKTDNEIWAEALYWAAAKDMSTQNSYSKVVSKQVVKEDPVASEVFDIALKLEEVTAQVNGLVRKVWNTTDVSDIEDVQRSADLVSKLASKVAPFTTEASNLKDLLVSYSMSLPEEDAEPFLNDETTPENLSDVFDGPGIGFEDNLNGLTPMGIKIKDDLVKIPSSAKTWFQLFRVFCEYLIEKDVVKFTLIADPSWRTVHGRTLPISMDGKRFKKPFELLPGVITEAACGSTQIQSAILNIMEYFEIPKDAVRIYAEHK